MEGGPGYDCSPNIKKNRSNLVKRDVTFMKSLDDFVTAHFKATAPVHRFYIFMLCYVVMTTACMLKV